MFEQVKKKLSQVTRIIPQKLSLSSQKFGFGIRDQLSGRKNIPDPDPGV
jgi:hypothetical protein